jgi:hypothetical protein
MKIEADKTSCGHIIYLKTPGILPRCELSGNSRYEKEIKTFWWVCGFTSIADTFIFEFGEIATICGSRISSAEV